MHSLITLVSDLTRVRRGSRHILIEILWTFFILCLHHIHSQLDVLRGRTYLYTMYIEKVFIWSNQRISSNVYLCLPVSSLLHSQQNFLGCPAGRWLLKAFPFFGVILDQGWNHTVLLWHVGPVISSITWAPHCFEASHRGWKISQIPITFPKSELLFVGQNQLWVNKSPLLYFLHVCEGTFKKRRSPLSCYCGASSK